MRDFNVGAIIVTYNPEINRFKNVIDSIANQIDKIIIVDNNSKNREKIKEILEVYKNTEIIENDKNYGIGKGLNIGVEKLKNSMDWILTLDQDTVVLVKIKELLQSNQLGDVGILALNPSEEKSKYNNEKFVNGDWPIISGSIVNSKVYENGIRYREEFFLDQIDFDFDYNVKVHGFKIITTTYKSTEHELGKNVNAFLIKNVKYENDWRIYLISRNSFKLLMERKINLLFFIRQMMYWGIQYTMKLPFKPFHSI
ncbi:MAG: glycosyltransferase, partial [Thermoplasmata archaeon]